MARLCIVIADHGYGHLAQTAPVIDALRRRRPELELVVRSRLPRERLAEHLGGGFELHAENPELGMCMDSALDVDAAASFAAHRALHGRWDAAVAAEAQAIADTRADLLLANVSYLAVAGAARAGVPALALCSLNWADIFRAYCGAFAGAAPIEAQMRASYARARAFIQPEPAMPMSVAAPMQRVGAIARRGRARREELAARHGLRSHERLVLLSLGGLPMPLDLSAWTRTPGVRWVVPEALHPGGEEFIALEGLGMPFIDVLCSCDALVTKPGYGSFVEAAVNGVPVLYTRRPDWPEEACLVDWLRRYGRCAELPRAALERGPGTLLKALWAQPMRPPPAASGAAQAAGILDTALNGGH